MDLTAVKLKRQRNIWPIRSCGLEYVWAAVRATVLLVKD